MSLPIKEKLQERLQKRFASLRSIGKILNKETGDDEAEKELKLKDKSDYARAFQMFQDGRPLTEVAIELDIETPTVICYYGDYLKLVNMGRLVTIYNNVKDDLPLFLDLYRRIKKERGLVNLRYQNF